MSQRDIKVSWNHVQAFFFGIRKSVTKATAYPSIDSKCFLCDIIHIGMQMMPDVFVFMCSLYHGETNGPKIIEFGSKCLKMVAIYRQHCDQGIRKQRKCLDIILQTVYWKLCPKCLFLRKSHIKLKLTVKKCSNLVQIIVN